jgi:NAD(P)H-hydrate epimerase
VLKILTVEQMKAVEAAADRQGISYAEMMENAGRAVAQAIVARVGEVKERKITVLAGPGNNGGDGLVAGRYLAEAGATVSIYLSKMRDESDETFSKARAAGLFIVDGENDQRWRVLKNLMHGAEVVVDALLGTGASLPVKGGIQQILTQAKRVFDERPSMPLVVAVDCPSGIDTDTGEVDPATLAADLTVTLAAAKRGQLLFPAADHTGELRVADIGIPADLPELADSKLELVSRESVAVLLPARPRNAHKGTFGRAIVVAGSVNYTGAAYFAAAAAYRAGAGLVTLAVPMPIYPAIAAQLPEATWIMLPHEMGVIASGAADVLAEELPNAQSLVVGPGFGQEKVTRDFLRRFLRAEDNKKGRIGFYQQSAPEATKSEAPKLPPMVLDADGLRLAAEIDGWSALLPADTILTPHPGEMAALTGLDKDAIQADRAGVAQKYAAEWGHVVVLKGAFTVVAAPDGRTAVLPFATPALARAGTGDVLAGAIAGLLAQGLASYDAAIAGGYLHGRAGELAAERVGTTVSVIAGDVLAALPAAIAEVEGK